MIAEIARLSEQLTAVEAGNTRIHELWTDALRERYELRTQLAAQQAAVPVGYRVEAKDERGIVRRDCLSRTPFDPGLPDAKTWAGEFDVTSTPLYAAPVAPQQGDMYQVALDAIELAEELGNDADAMASYAGATGGFCKHAKQIEALRARLNPSAQGEKSNG